METIFMFKSHDMKHQMTFKNMAHFMWSVDETGRGDLPEIADTWSFPIAIISLRA